MQVVILLPLQQIYKIYVTCGNNMIVPLIFVFVTLTHALDTKNANSEEIKKVIMKHLNKIHDIEERYVTNQHLARSIAKYLGGKISVFPLFRISMKIDRKPVRVPWKLGELKHYESNEAENITKYRIRNGSRHRRKHRKPTEAPSPTGSIQESTTENEAPKIKRSF